MSNLDKIVNNLMSKETIVIDEKELKEECKKVDEELKTEEPMKDKVATDYAIFDNSQESKDKRKEIYDATVKILPKNDKENMVHPIQEIFLKSDMTIKEFSISLGYSKDDYMSARAGLFVTRSPKSMCIKLIKKMRELCIKSGYPTNTRIQDACELYYDNVSKKKKIDDKKGIEEINDERMKEREKDKNDINELDKTINKSINPLHDEIPKVEQKFAIDIQTKENILKNLETNNKPFENILHNLYLNSGLTFDEFAEEKKERLFMQEEMYSKFNDDQKKVLYSLLNRLYSGDRKSISFNINDFGTQELICKSELIKILSGSCNNVINYINYSIPGVNISLETFITIRKSV